MGEGAIHIAARYNHISVLQYLCDAGANVNLQDKVRSDRITLISAITILLVLEAQCPVLAPGLQE